MARLLKTNTAVRLVVGPFIKITDFYTLYTGATVTNLAMNQWHEHDDGSAPTQTISAVAFTAAGGGTNDMVELAGGYYDIEITQAQTNFLGRAKFNIYDASDMLPYFEDWIVVPATVFDQMVTYEAGVAGGAILVGSNAATTFATLTSTGAFTVGSIVNGGVFTQTGAVSLASTLGVAGVTTLASLSITGQLDAGNVLVDTTTVLTGAVTLSSTLATGSVTLSALTVTNATTLTGAVSMGSTLGITGAVTLSSTLGTGAVTLSSLAITGAASVGTTTTLTGAVSTGAVTLNGLAITNALSVGTTTTLTGAVTLSSTLGTGAVTLSSLTVTNNASIGGTLGVTGTTTFAAFTVTGALTTGSIVNSGVFTQTGTHTISALTVTNALTAGTNAIPWNAAYDAEVESEVVDAVKPYFQLLTRKDSAITTDNAAILTLINASGGSGAGTYTNQTDALEAIRDRGDAGWITSVSFGIPTSPGGGPAYNYLPNRDDIIQEALELISVYDPGKTLSAEDINSCTRTLRMMIQAFRADDIGLWANREAALFLQEDEYSYNIGPSGGHCSISWIKTELASAAASGATSITVDSVTDLTDNYDRDGICTAQTPTASGYLTLNGALVADSTATLPSERKISIYSPADDSGRTFTITGTAADHETVTETVTGPNTGLVYSTETFYTVTAILISDASVGAVEIGCVGDNIGIELDDGTIQWNFITGALSTTVTLVTALTAAASVDNHVYVYDKEIERPVEIIEARRRDAQGKDTPINLMARTDYERLSDKTSGGTINSIYYDPQMTRGVLKTWPACDDTQTYLVMTVRYPLEDVVNGTDQFDMPPEWMEMLAWNLAVRIAPKHGKKLTGDFIARAELMKEKLKDSDRENASVSIKMTR